MNRCFKAKNKYLRKEDMAALKLKKYHNPMLKLFGQKAHIYELSIENLYSGQSAMTIFFPLNEEHRVRFKINAVRSRELYQELVDKKISIDFEFNGKKMFSLANYHINHVKKNHGNDIYIDAGYNGLTDMIKKLFYNNPEEEKFVLSSDDVTIIRHNFSCRCWIRTEEEEEV